MTICLCRADPDGYVAMVRTTGNADGDTEGRIQPRRERERGRSPKVQGIIAQGSTANRPDILVVTRLSSWPASGGRFDWGLPIVDFGFRIHETCDPSGCRGTGCAIFNRRSSIRIAMVRAGMARETLARELRIGRHLTER
jgi:hypothetical protein